MPIPRRLLNDSAVQAHSVHNISGAFPTAARIERTPRIPPHAPVPLSTLREAVPARCFVRSTLRSLIYIIRHVGCMYALYAVGTRIRWAGDMLCAGPARGAGGEVGMGMWAGAEGGVGAWAAARAGAGAHGAEMTGSGHGAWAWAWEGWWCGVTMRWTAMAVLWTAYWAVQGLAFAGMWCLGHEAGHHALSDSKAANTALGVLAHTFVLTPYHAWRVTHAMHHKATNDLDRDETYIPPVGGAHAMEETPIATLFKLLIRQFFGFQLYLLHNRKGNPRYPPGTSHYLPSCKLFKPKHYSSILASNTAIFTMLLLLGAYARAHGWAALGAHYVMPWLWAHNWIVLFTYLQHSDPRIPYYRKGEWTFARGALATVDRPLLGWAGRFFMHNLSSDHVAHHFFPTIPFYNLPEATAAIRPLLGEHYVYDDTPALHALWRSFTRCVYLEPVSVDLDARRGAAGERVGSRTDAVGGEGVGEGASVGEGEGEGEGVGVGEGEHGAECKGEEGNEGGSERKRAGAVLFFRDRRGMPAFG